MTFNHVINAAIVHFIGLLSRIISFIVDGGTKYITCCMHKTQKNTHSYPLQLISSLI